MKVSQEDVKIFMDLLRTTVQSFKGWW